MNLRPLYTFVAMCVLGVGIPFAFADAPFEITPAPGLSSGAADGQYLRLDLTNDPLTGDELLGDPPSNQWNIAVDHGAGDSLVIGDDDGNPAIAFYSYAGGQIRSVGPFVPSSAGNFDLGDSVRRWEDLYLEDADITTDGTDTTFSADSQLKLNGNTAGVDIQSSGASRLTVNSVAVYPRRDVLPTPTELYNLGGVSNRWVNLHLEDSDITTNGTDTTFSATNDLDVDAAVDLRLVGGAVDIRSDLSNEVKIGVNASVTLEVGETNVFIDGDFRQSSTGDYVQVGYDNVAGGTCTAPVTCAASSLGAQFVCNDTNTTKSSNLCVCLRDTADAYVWVGLYGAGGSTCP